MRWLGVRPDRRVPLVEIAETAIVPSGLADDRRTAPGKRAVTLVQWEHLDVIANLLGRDRIDPALLRRNIVVSGINLLALRKTTFRVGTTVLKGTGLCAPCSRMEETFGPGGFTAVRGHGGITAEVLVPGDVCLGDAVSPAPDHLSAS